MNDRSRISATQLCLLLLASRLSNCLLLTPESTVGLPWEERLAAIALSGALLFLLFVPTLLLRASPLDCAYRRSRACGRAVGAAYTVLFLFILCLDVIQFYDFAEKVMKGEFSVTALTVALIAVAFAASLYGIQALGRTALPVAVFSVICLLTFSLALLPEMKLLHFPPLPGSGARAVWHAAVNELPRTAETVAIGWLYPYIRGSRPRALGAFCGSTALLTGLVVTTAWGVLGEFATAAAYPYYTAITAAQLGVFQRMDILIIAVWLATFFVRLTLFCTAFTDTARRLLGKRFRIPAAAAGTVLLSAFTWILRDHRSWDVITVIYGVALAVFCLVLPTVLGLSKRRKAR
ncbi:MAG: GerAB/ArcD/ProY family transporter [Clostridia bacterium]|nr:GerAB/ArcD/ProY family transporter [Clostridia bacterium]